MRSASLDFKAVNRRALSDMRAVLLRFLPGGLFRGQEYLAINPRRPDRHLGSFKINLQTGRWSDFATGDSGGDVVSLIAYVQNIGQAEAARELLEAVGGGHA